MFWTILFLFLSAITSPQPVAPSPVRTGDLDQYRGLNENTMNAPVPALFQRKLSTSIRSSA
jgi:hypothetical protein